MRIWSLFRRSTANRELDEEIRYHIERQIEENIAGGMTPEEARYAALRQFNGVEQRKEECRDVRHRALIDNLMKDLRYACRILASRPGFALTAVLTIGLGIGINTTIFSVYNAVALRPLPVANPSQVIRLKRWFENSSRGDMQYEFSYPEYKYARDHNDVFSAVVAASTMTPVLTGTEKFQTELVTANYFSALGIHAELGRTFLPDEDQKPGGNPVIVLSHSFWLRRFDGDPAIAGKTLNTDEAILTIAGVAPPEFTGTSISAPVVPDFWALASIQPQLVPERDWLNDPRQPHFQILGRLRPGASLWAAQSEADTLLRQFRTTYREADKTILVTAEHTALFGNVDDIWFRLAVGALMLMVAMVLVVACANVANMVLAHGIARQREIGIRLAIGAGRARIVRQLVTESLILALTGGVIGLALSMWITEKLWSYIAALAVPFLGGITLSMDLRPDIRVFTYTLILSVATGIVFGLLPALQITRSDLVRALRDDGGFFARAMRRSRLRRILIAAQVTISMVFLIAAGLLMRGFLRSEGVSTGFETQTVFTTSTDWGRNRSNANTVIHDVFERVRALPEIDSVARGYAPFVGTWTPPVIVDGRLDRTLASLASNSYFETLKIPIVRGRPFTESEATNGAHVAVISEATARRFWPGQDPLQKHFRIDRQFRREPTEYEVIGVARDIRFANPTRIDPAHVYLPTNLTDSSIPTLLFRIHGDQKAALAAVTKAIGDVDPSLLPYLEIMNLENGPLRLQKFLSSLFSIFVGSLALLALGLASIGIYGVMSYVVSQRIREIGIRMALGAHPRAILQAIVLEGLPPVFAGLVLGLSTSLALSWAFHKTLSMPGSSDFLYGVPFYDPIAFVGLSGFLILIAALASLIPAKRALAVDPMSALRHN